jgi:hypothetical protein
MSKVTSSEPHVDICTTYHNIILPCVGVKTERIISDQPTDRRFTEGKNEFDQIVDGYGHRYG